MGIIDPRLLDMVPVIKTVNSLRRMPLTGSLSGISGDVVLVMGQSSPGDGGFAFYRWVAGNTDADDGNNTIRCNINPSAGRWKKLPFTSGSSSQYRQDLTFSFYPGNVWGTEPDAEAGDIADGGIISQNSTIYTPLNPALGQKMTYIFRKDVGNNVRTVTFATAAFLSNFTMNAVSQGYSVVEFVYTLISAINANRWVQTGAQVDFT